MKYRLRLTSKAEADIDGVIRWFHESQATESGKRWLASLLAKINSLETNAERCGLAAESEELGIEIKQLLFGKRKGVYRILFQIDGQVVNVLHIRHCARNQLSHDDLES